MNSAQRQLMTFVGQWDRQRRLTQLAVWLPRGLAVGLGVAILAAIISRLTPWLTAQQMLSLTVAAAFVGLLLTGLAVWLWPRSAKASVQYFDQVFGLKERTGTAFELLKGTIRTSPQMSQLQVQDMLSHAATVDARRALPVRWQGRELAGVIVLAIIALLASLLANPQTAALARQQALSNAISQQIQQLQAIKNNVNQNPALNPLDKVELNRIADAAINQLQQPKITQAEAVAALTQAAQSFNAAQTQLSQTQLAAAQAAAQALNQSQTTQGTAQELASGNLSAAASQLQDLGQRVGSNQLTQDQMNEAATALNQAASQLSNMNPALAQALKQAAQDLANGNSAQAQQDLNAAAQALQNQQQQNSQTAQSQAARGAASQAVTDGQQLSQLNQSQTNTSQSNLSQSDQSQIDPNGNHGPNDGNANQPNSADNQANNQNSQNGQNAGNQANQNGNNPSQSNSASGQNPNVSNNGGLGGASLPNPGGQPGKGYQPIDGSISQGSQGTQGQSQNIYSGPAQGPSDGGSAQNSSGQQGSAGNAGLGQNNPGSDVTNVQPGNHTGPAVPGSAQGGGNVTPYEPVFAPWFMGGSGGVPLNPPNSNTNGNGEITQVQGPNSTGNATVPLSDVASQAASQADQAMDTDHVPGALRGVIRQYFSDLSNQPSQSDQSGQTSSQQQP